MTPQRMLLDAAVLCLAAHVLFAPTARAQLDDDLLPASRSFTSAERFVLELRGGLYEPDMGNDPTFDRFFGDDAGPLLALQLSVIVFRIPDAVYFGAGGGIGWADYDGHAVDPAGQRVSEETDLTVTPLSALAEVRVDLLPRRFRVPFIVTGKLGYQWAHWDTDTGSRDDADGWSHGLLFGGQLALDLDTFEPAAARTMDEEWGINHSFLFFELFKWKPSSSSLPLGDTSWAIGLGFVF